MTTITFTVTPCEETGGYVAVWDAPDGQGGISTQGDTLAELHDMVADAVNGWFSGDERPKSVRLHFVEDPEFALA
jgi:predicted RNase H-like HicB family nuclease